ncbi:translocon-associated protein subunit alpha [Tribolium castaneum]|uniref:Translocon-associated protein subunit alpha n=1 Tax=Tribolium castaneum TaxID=7070 RepID=D6WHE5_TRICA|nr:PREDICTED: translocon-associated protein subunit alpha [Tribolium castaneum]EFA00653.1 Translocon-associated protein subunit alpha-like Protein [Tribolium castaneum]|eukprot:XP_975256.1 PREDICTED: translocon-associated protein subunit alpha [Tribolium castaneum]
MKYFFLISLLVFPAVIFTLDNGLKMVAHAEEDPLEDEVEVEGEADVEEVAPTDAEDEEDSEKTTASPDADTTLLFVRPIATASQLELPAGVPVEFLVGFRNKGKEDFVLESLEASFRYPMDFNFYIQNFSAIGYSKVVQPEQEATLAYSFIPSEAFAGRPFGLNINLAYRDASGNSFQEAVYNETVQIIELEEGLDGETFFLYVFLVAGVVLLLVIGQQTLLSFGKKRITRKAAPVETGTSNPNNVDYDWLPKQTLATLNKEKSQKSPKSIKQSPRQRKVKRSTGSE